MLYFHIITSIGPPLINFDNVSNLTTIVGVRLGHRTCLVWYTYAVDDTRRKELIDEWAARLERWGLMPVAPILLQVIRPLGFIGSQALLFGQPFLTFFADAQSLD